MFRYTPESIPLLLLSALERLVALVALLVLAPVLIVVGFSIALLSGASPLIGHRRVGRGGRPFWVLKFRTMWPVSAGRQSKLLQIDRIVDETGPLEKDVNDNRVTSVFARFCRRHSIDELPQLWHVVRGEMSLVGPRPITAAEWTRHYRREAAEVLAFKPGISGLWQTMGRSRLTYEQRRKLDVMLVRNRSVGLYFRILLWTVPEVWNGRNAW
ncbi:MAG: sugar transferase [Bryobacteraceae bacterium]